MRADSQLSDASLELSPLIPTLHTPPLPLDLMRATHLVEDALMDTGRALAGTALTGEVT
jgi:hypothetical protein